MDIKREPKNNIRKYIPYGLGLIAVAAVSVGIVRLEPAARSVSRQVLMIDAVKQGDMVRDVSAPGTLVPERVRIVTALTAGRVEELPIRPGATLRPGTVIVTLVNPDENLQMLQYRQALGQAISAQASLRSSLVQQQTSQETIIAAARSGYNTALRNASMLDSLEKTQKGLASRFEIAAAQDVLAEAKTRLESELLRYEEMKRSAGEQIRLNDEQVSYSRSILEEQVRRLQSMRVVAPEGGQLQTLGNPQLEYGQYVQAGTELARIAQPGRLKAVLRVPDIQAKDVALGQRVTIGLHNNTTVRGRVMRYDPAAQGGSVTVEVEIIDPIPPGVRAEQTIDGRIEIERLTDVVHVGRPSYGNPPGTISLWVLSPDETEANLVPVELGSASVSLVQVKRGLAIGQKVIISDMSQFDDATRVRIKQ